MKEKKNSSIKAGSADVDTLVVENVSNETTTKSKKSVNPDNLEDTANSLEDENNPKKKDVFSKVKRDVFGISDFDGNTDDNREMALKFAKGEISFEDYTKFISSARKETSGTNKEKENLSFEDVCEKISKSEFAKDFCSFVTSDLLSLKSLLINGDKVVIFHGKQSETGDKFIADKVTIKGKHKPYTDTIYKSFAEISTSSILKSFQCYGYYKSSLKRCRKQRNNEYDKTSLFASLVTELHENFGFSKDDMVELIESNY